MRGEITDEKGVKRKVKQLLDKHGWFWWMPSANGYGTSGVSDFCALKAGVFLAVETKFGTNKPTEMQKAFLRSIQAESGFGFVVTDKSLPEFEFWLAAFERSSQAYAGGAREEAADGAGMLDAMRVMQAYL